ncbi:MAG TPA: HIT domain-containing protein [Candidatus Saccharimonadales bacterium]|nr:HIT domain-containing protein [Candidatus Saccharimonadales bacterium]
MDGCPFCMVDGVRTRTLRDSESARVILSNPRLMKGHLLVVPKRHVERPWELTDIELKEIFSHIHSLQKKLSTIFGTGCDVRQNYRPFMKQGRLKIDHLHFHLLPRTFQDALYEKSMKFETDMFADLLDEEANEVRRLLGA